MLRTKSVLLVESRPDAARSTWWALELAGAQVSIARTIPEALAAARELPLDAVVASVFLPNGECYALRVAIETTFPDLDVPVVAICGDADEIVYAVARAIELNEEARFYNREPEESPNPLWSILPVRGGRPGMDACPPPHGA